MHNTTSYQFKCLRPRAFWYLPLCFIGIPFILLLPENAPMPAFFSVILAPMVIAFVLIARKINRQERIELRDSYLKSRLFGQVGLADIQSASSSIWASSPNLYLKLKDGRKIGWSPGAALNQNRNKKDLSEFIAAFDRLIQHQAGASAEPAYLRKSPPFASQQAPIPATDKPPVAPDNGQVSKLRLDLQAVKKKNRTMQKIAIPAGLVFGVLMYVHEVVLPGIQKHKNDQIREILRHGRQHNKEMEDRAIAFAYRYSRLHGPYYLYSNDSTAYIRYLPTVFTEKSGDALAENDKLTTRMTSPDSQQWNMYAYNGISVYRFGKSNLNIRDSTRTYLYLTVTDPAKQLHNPYGNPKRTDSLGFLISLAIPVYNVDSLQTYLDAGTHGELKLALFLIRQAPRNAKLYMAAREGEGRMNQALFEKATSILKKELSELQIDTARFNTRQFPDGEQ